jgi:two-component system sensor histidine kinase/response regulator
VNAFKSPVIQAGLHSAAKGPDNYRSVFDANPDPVVISRAADAKIVLVNASFVSLSGFTLEESLGRTPIELGLWPDPEECDRCVRLLQQDRQFDNLPMTFRLRHGDRPFLISAATVLYDGEECFITIARDVSELRATEAALVSTQKALALKVATLEMTEQRLLQEIAARERSDLQFRKILETNLDIVAINDWKTGNYIEVNDEFLRVLGYSREDLISHNSAELGIWSQKARAAFVDPLRRDGTVRNIEADLVGKDGKPIPCLLSAALTTLDGRKCCVSISRDISALRETENRLHEAESTLRKVIESSPDAISINRASDGVCIAVNEGFVRMSGLAAQEILGRAPREIGVWADRAELKRFMERLTVEKVIPSYGFTAARKGGSTFPALLSGRLTTGSDDEQLVITITRDISDIKKTESDLIAAREAALAASRAKSDFLSSMSHEIRTPMNAIFGMTDLLARSNLTAEQRRFLNIMKANSESLLDLLNDILDLAKIESGHLVLDSVAFDLEEEVSKVGEIMALRAHEKGIELTLHIAPDVPTSLIGDPLRLRQIIINLLGNAIKFTEKGEVSLDVTRHLENDRTGVENDSQRLFLEFRITDSGMGIPVEKLGIIFSSFEQGDSSTTRQYGGTGLGLAIVRRLVTLYAGEVTAASKVGVGSSFRFTAEFGFGSKITDKIFEVGSLRGSRVLVVDDSAVNRLIVRESLSAEGAEVVEAADGIEAMGILAAPSDRPPFRLALIDCKMPRLSGMELAEKMKGLTSNGANCPPAIVMLSSSDLSESQIGLRDARIAAYLVKPIKRSDLLETVGRVLGRPVDNETTALEPVRMGPVPMEPAPRSLPYMRILIVDDSAVNRMLLREYLGDQSVEIEEAENGQVACEKVKDEPFDVVIMDMRMPVMDGYAATMVIRDWEWMTQQPPIPVIALTASALREDVDRCLSVGCNYYLSKPVKREALIGMIASATKRDAAAHDERIVVKVEKSLRDITPSFLAMKAKDISVARAAVEQLEFQSVRRVGHDLKGEGRAYGFENLSELGEALEDAALRQDSVSALRLITQLSAFFEQVEVEFSL